MSVEVGAYGFSMSLLIYIDDIQQELLDVMTAQQECLMVCGSTSGVLRAGLVGVETVVCIGGALYRQVLSGPLTWRRPQVTWERVVSRGLGYVPYVPVSVKYAAGWWKGGRDE